MLHFVNFKMALTCFMSPRGEEAVGWDDGMYTRMQFSSLNFWVQVRGGVDALFHYAAFYLFLFIYFCHPCLPLHDSGSVCKPSLQPCDLISLTDSGRLGKVSPSTVPFLFRFTLSVTNSLWHLSVAVFSVGRPSMVSSHTCTYALRLGAQTLPGTWHTQSMHTCTGRVQGNTQPCKYAKSMAIKEGGTLSPGLWHTYYVLHTNP